MKNEVIATVRIVWIISNPNFESSSGCKDIPIIAINE